MNCKQGDLAIIVTSANGNEGKIVRCLRLATPEDADRFHVIMSVATWFIDINLPTRRGDAIPLIPDRRLRPIRAPGDDAVDETLLWLPSPTRQKEPA